MVVEDGSVMLSSELLICSEVLVEVLSVERRPIQLWCWLWHTVVGENDNWLSMSEQGCWW